MRLILEYTTYAQIEITRKGHRHLKLDGYTYGEVKVFDHSVYWRCTTNLKNEAGKYKSCKTCVVTEVRNGSFLMCNLKWNPCTLFHALSLFLSLSHFLSFFLSCCLQIYLHSTLTINFCSSNHWFSFQAMKWFGRYPKIIIIQNRRKRKRSRKIYMEQKCEADCLFFLKKW